MTFDSALLLQLDNEAHEEFSSSAFVAVGGASAVAAVVDEFYQRLLVDPLTEPFFAPLQRGDGLAALKRHQVLMLTKVLGGPDRYTGRDLETAHARMSISAEVYQRVSLYLLTVMHDFKVPMDILQTADSVLRDVGPLVVSAPAPTEAGR